MLTFRTRSHPRHKTPSLEKMREVAKKVGVKEYSPSLVADFCNLARGGKVIPTSSYSLTVWEQAVEKAKKAAGKKPLTHEAIQTKYNELMRYHSRVIQFVRGTNLARFPGRSPLEKTMSMLKLLADSSKGGFASSSISETETLPIFSEKTPDQITESLNDIMDVVDSLSDSETDMIDPSGEGHELDQESDGQRSGANDLKALKIAEKMKPGTAERQILEIARKLNTFTQMEVRKQKRVIADPESDQIRRRPIRSLGELGKLPADQWALRQALPKGYWNYLAVTGGVVIRERYTEEERKQAILILLDGSGSMEGEKHTKATGVVMNRLQAVVDGDAEVYLGVFDTQLKIVGQAKSSVEARELIKKFRANNFKGGGTNIATAVKEGHAYIEKKIDAGEALWRPEIVVLTDEDSSVSGISAHEIPGTTVHGFAMSVSNPGLVAFARSTGGVGIEKF